jgi:hypothetical protein
MIENAESYHQIYNNLPQVENAWKDVAEIGKLEEFWREVCQLAIENDLVDLVCIRLAHKHWELRNSEIMYETEGIYQGRKAWITKPTEITALEKEEPYPSFWMIAGQSYLAAEYSNQEEAKKILSEMTSNTQFFKNFNSIAKK